MHHVEPNTGIRSDRGTHERNGLLGSRKQRLVIVAAAGRHILGGRQVVGYSLQGDADHFTALNTVKAANPSSEAIAR